MHWIIIPKSPDIAQLADACGVDQIMVDLESVGKADRQLGSGAHISEHSIGDISLYANALKSAELLVRVNPLGDYSRDEIQEAIDRGARRLMLPMFRSAREVETFLALVAGRARVTLLVETPQALARLPTYAGLLEEDDLIHFGLNDLRIALGLSFLFEVIAGGFMEAPAEFCRRRGISFGIGGVGRVGHGQLPAEIVMGELVRLGANWVILSRAFHESLGSAKALQERLDLRLELEKLRQVEREYISSPEILDENRKRFCERAFALGAKVA